MVTPPTGILLDQVYDLSFQVHGVENYSLYNPTPNTLQGWVREDCGQSNCHLILSINAVELN